MKILLISLLSCLAFNSATAQVPQFDWAFGYDQTFTRKIITDDSRNIYGVGSFSGSTDMDPGTGTSTATSVGQQDIFISKFDPDGNLIWYKTMGGVDSEGILDVKFNNQGELVMTGYFNLSVDMDPSSNTFLLTSAGNYDVFILKMDINGNFIGATSIGGTGNEESFALDIDSNDDIIVTGYFSNSADFDPSSSNSFLSASGRDIFVSRYTTNFNFQWAKAFPNSTPSFGGFYNRGYDLVIDNESNIHIVGEFAGTVDFDPNPGVLNLTSSPLPAVSPDINTFYVKLSSTGQLVNAHKILALNPVLTKDSNDDLIIGGSFASTNSDFDFGIGVQNIINSTLTSTYYLLKFTNTGTFIWVKGLGANGNSIRPSIVTDNSNSVYFTSNFTSTSDFDPSSNTFNLTSAGSSNVFITKLDLDGEFSWALSFGSTSSGVTNVNSMVLDNQSAIISTGSYGTLADMDPSTSVFNLTGGGNYYQKLYVCSNTNSILDINQCNSYTAPDGVNYNTSGTYTATIPNAAGCDSTITVNLTINQPTSSAITPEACESYTAPDGQVYTVGGNYTAIIPNSAGCDSTISINLTIQNVNAGISVSGITMSATNSGMQYQWLNCATNQIIGLPTTQSFTPSTNGEYAVIVYHGNCSDTSDCITISSVSLIEDQISNFTISPNPVTSFALIEGISKTLANEIELITSTGIVVKKFNITSDQMLLDLNGIASGIYFIRIGSEIVRLVKD
jgi:hypothetical protein